MVIPPHNRTMMPVMVGAALWMLLWTDLGASSLQRPVEHYDLTTVCRNDTNTTLDGIHQLVLIHPITVTLSVSLFGPLRANHANMFHCAPSATSTATNKGGLYLYTSTDLYGAKNRLENCKGWSDSRHDDCSLPHTDSSNSTIATGSDPKNLALTPTVWDSIVLWIQPSDATDSGRAAILTIGRRENRMTTTTTTIRILQSGSHLIVIRETIHIVTPSNYDDDDVIESTMITTTTTFLVPDYDLTSNPSTTTQLVLIMNKKDSMDATDTLSDDPANIQIYVNGQPMLLNLERMDSIRTTQNQQNDNVDGKFSTPTLQLFSNHYAEDDVFLGSIYQLDIYDAILTYDEVMTLYELGVGDYYNAIADDDHSSNPAIIPYYYLDDDEVDRYTAIHDVTSKTKRPLRAKLSTMLYSTTSLQLPQQVGFVVVYQTSSQHSDRINNTATLIQLHSYNHSNPLMQLGIQITSLPAHGVVRFVYRSGGDVPIIMISSNGTNVDQTISICNDDEKLTGECIVQENDIYLLRGNMTSVTISYEILSEYRHYFNIPTHDGYGMDLHVIPESLSYRIVEVPMSLSDIISDSSSPLDETLLHRIIIKSSDIVTMPIYVVHVNDVPPPTIKLGQQVQQQEPQLETNEQSNSTLTMIILNDYQVMIPDGIIVLFSSDNVHDLDYVRVDVITVSDGTITLHPDRLTVLSVAHQHCIQRYYSNWQCTELLKNDGTASDATSSGGSGSGFSHVTFVALPSDVPTLLNQMVFTSQLAGQGGNVTIRIYSGTGNEDCLYPKEHYSNYIAMNQVSDNATSTKTNSSMAAKVVVMDYILAQNDTCTKSEATVVIPNFATGRSDDNNAGHTKDGFTMFGFAWKELIFGTIIVAIFLFCFCGGCSIVAVPSLPVIVRRPTTTRWMICYRLSKKQLNYNDYID